MAKLYRIGTIAHRGYPSYYKCIIWNIYDLFYVYVHIIIIYVNINIVSYVSELTKYRYNTRDALAMIT